jgi:transposase
LESSFRDNFRSIILSLLVSGVDLSRARIFFEDETRIGLMVILRRVLTVMGVKPVSNFQHRFENFYVYGAVEPSTGERFFLELPYLNSEMFQIFIDEFSKKYGDTINIMVVDNGRYHIARALEIPRNVEFVFLPPYSPELNPIERLWQFIKDKLASVGVFKNLEEVQKKVEDILSRLTSSEVQSITGYQYIMNVINALSIF